MTQPPPPGYGAPYGGAPMPAGDHPEATKLLVLSIVSLVCCGPVAIYTFIASNNILNGPQTGLNTSKINTAKIISIVALALWAIGVLIRIASLATGG